MPKWAGKYGPCSSAASVTDIQVRSFAASCRKTRISLAPFGKKCRLFGKVRALLLGGFSHGRTVRSFAASCRKTRIFLAPFGKKCRSSGWVPVGFSHGHSSPLLRRLVSQTPNFPRPFRQKKHRSSGWVPCGFSLGRAAPAGTVHCAMSILRAGLTGHTGNTGNGTWHRVCHIPSKCQSTWLSVSFVPLP